MKQIYINTLYDYNIHLQTEWVQKLLMYGTDLSRGTLYYVRLALNFLSVWCRQISRFVLPSMCNLLS